MGKLLDDSMHTYTMSGGQWDKQIIHLCVPICKVREIPSGTFKNGNESFESPWRLEVGFDVREITH